LGKPAHACAKYVVDRVIEWESATPGALYYNKNKVAKSDPATYDTGLQDKLWDWSLKYM
jgi:hypothetical protein